MTSNLDETLKALWADLVRGAADKKSPLNRPGIATVAISGGPACRTVVLRDVTPSDRSLVFHTDVRSEKVCELRANPLVAWHFWNPRANIQIRVSAQAALHHDDATAHDAWSALHEGSRKTYAQIATPGTALADVNPSGPTQLSLEDAAQNFVVVATKATAVDWLHLARSGHRRAQWTWDAEACRWRGSWVGA
ncbi:MAG: pyridoxamine 5'-phosphate oxidase family protein [Pseudomonadota bacterium]